MSGSCKADLAAARTDLRALFLLSNTQFRELVLRFHAAVHCAILSAHNAANKLAMKDAVLQVVVGDDSS